MLLAIGIKIISASPGPSTSEQILSMIQTQSTGITIKQLSNNLHRPVSMIQVCLKNLIATKQIYTRKNKTGVGLIYYPSSIQSTLSSLNKL
jgi:predicted transcriptional regulator